MFHIVTHYVLYKFTVCVYIYVCVCVYMVVLIQVCFINGSVESLETVNRGKENVSNFLSSSYNKPLIPAHALKVTTFLFNRATYLIICLHLKYIITCHSWFCFYPVIIYLYKTHLFVKFRVCQYLFHFIFKEHVILYQELLIQTE